jgi:hypothetical protein
VVICATGYAYTFPFLDAAVEVVAGGGWTVKNLYKGLFYQPDPSLSFMGLQNVLIGPCQVFEAQARLVAKVVSGDVSLASVEGADHLKEEEQQQQEGDRPVLGRGTEAYIDDLSTLSGVTSTYRGMSSNLPAGRFARL